jgi:threonine synthase
MNVGSLYHRLICSECNAEFNINELNNYCHDCHQPLVASYKIDSTISKDIIDKSERGLWRYKKLLPVISSENIVTLGEGMTPTYELKKYAALRGYSNLKMKDEALNPTGSFKARGMSLAVSKAKELGVETCCAPTAGNAGSALAAYCAAAGLKSKVYMPKLTPKIFSFDAEIMGAEVFKVEGSIRDAGLAMQKDNQDGLMWDVSTMKEPFRLEGKKTLGYEIAEQYDFNLPDVIFYPTGGGTGLIGMWKAFHEMKTMGWLEKMPRMIAVQMEGCDPVVKAFELHSEATQLCEEPLPTAANGLRVPKAFADKLIMKTLYESSGHALRVNEDAMIATVHSFAKIEGIFLSPEGAALLVALDEATQKGLVNKQEQILLINTGSGYKYIENLW